MQQPGNRPRDASLVGPFGRRGQARFSPQARPCPPARLVEIVELQRGIAEEISQADGARIAAGVAPRIGHRSQLRDEAGEARAEAPFHVGEDDAGGNPVQLNRTARRQPREPLLDLPDDVRSMTAQERAQAEVKTKPPVRTSNEVQHGQAGLAVRPSQTATELLEKYQRTLSWAQKEDGVDLWNVHPFVEEVDAEHDVHRAVPQIT